MICGLDQRIELGDDARTLAVPRVAAFRARSSPAAPHAGRTADCSSLRSRCTLREAGELQEELMQVFADGLIAGEQPVIRIGARGFQVIVAGAHVAIALEPLGLPPHDR